MKRFLLAPALHFLLIGSLLFAAEGLRKASAAGARAEREQLVIPASRIERLREGFRASWGRPPRADEERGLIEEAIDDEVLFRRALGAGLDRGNAFVRDRLVTLMRFLAEDPKEDDEALLRQARSIGLDRSDPVVRRSLVEIMRLIATRAGGAEGPVSEAELRDAYEQRTDLFRAPARIRLSHVFLSRDRRGATLDRDARALAALLREKRLEPPPPGDPFPYGPNLPLLAETDLERRFGSGFVRALASQPEGEWIGPIESSYGLHIVRIDERRPGEILPFESARGRLEHIVRNERGEERARQALAEWRTAYDIRVEHPSRRASISQRP